jgi:hypothetical protein
VPETTIPLYSDWSFWTVVVAAIAIALSQLPPIHILLKKASLDMELYSRIHITHKVGNPNLSSHLILNNNGGRVIKIRKITATIKKDGKQIAVLPAQNYLQNPNDKTPILLTTFSLKPKQEWAHTVNFLNYFSRTDEKEYRKAESKLKTNIMEKRKITQEKDSLIEADSKYVKPFTDIFNAKFLWHADEYEMCVSVNVNPEKASIEKTYRFTLFESDSEELSKHKDDFKYGDGLYWNSANHLGLSIQIIEA